VSEVATIDADCWLRPAFARRYVNTLVNGLSTIPAVKEYWFVTLLAALQGVAYLNESGEPITSLLDVGCGPATRTTQLREKLSTPRTVGLDYSPTMIEQAKLFQDFLPASQRIELIQGSADALPFADKAFDVVVCYGLLMCMEEAEEAVKEMLRVSRLGLVAIEESHSYMDASEQGVYARASTGGATPSRYWHDYLSLFTAVGAKTVIYSPIPKPAIPNPPCMVRFIVPSASA
jgi:SAM-dependent methyltransferase